MSGSRRLIASLLGLALSMISTSGGAETVPARGSVDARIRTTTYNADEVYKLQGFVGYAVSGGVCVYQGWRRGVPMTAIRMPCRQRGCCTTRVSDDGAGQSVEGSGYRRLLTSSR